jgi:hypothetical protein
VSSSAELGSLGLDPSHLSFVPSSSGKGRKVNVEMTLLPSVEFVIYVYNKKKKKNEVCEGRRNCDMNGKKCIFISL